MHQLTDEFGYPCLSYCVCMKQASADGVLLVWRLPESFYRAMRDRLAELYTNPFATAPVPIALDATPSNGASSAAQSPATAPTIDHASSPAAISPSTIEQSP